MSPWEGAILGERDAHCKVGLCAVSCAKTAEPIDFPFGLWTWVCRRKHMFNRIRQVAQMCTISFVFARWRQFTGRHCRELWKKRLNRSICRLGCGLEWAERSTSSTAFARWCQCAHMTGHIGATCRTRFNPPSAAAMRSYVKLL